MPLNSVGVYTGLCTVVKTSSAKSVDTMQAISEDALRQIFSDAHTAHGFLEQPVTDQDLRAIYDLAKMGPTSMNCQPARYVFLRTPQAKERLKPCLMKGNVEQTMSAPVTVIVAIDNMFYQHMPEVWHDPAAKAMFAERPQMAQDTATRNGTLGGAYFIIAARALGFDCGPMSGFNSEKLNQEFFPDGNWSVNFLLNLGKADPAKIHARNQRLDFKQACQLL